MAQRILLTLDGSTFAEQALDIATDLAQQRQAELTLMQVVSAESELPESETYLQSKAKEVEKNHVTCQVKSTLGNPAEHIVKESQESDLLVMTSHGHSQFDQIVLGGVTERVTRNSACPVFVLKERHLRLRDIRRVLVPLDGYQLSLDAIPEAVEMCKATGATLCLCRINEAAGVNLGLLSKQNESHTLELFLNETAQSIDSSVKVETFYDFGSAARRLLALIVKEQIDLVVMTSHGRGGFNRWVCGSVAENVLRSSQAPVMLLRRQ